jgi:hypothetical protein
MYTYTSSGFTSSSYGEKHQVYVQVGKLIDIQNVIIIDNNDFAPAIGDVACTSALPVSDRLVLLL